MYVDVHQHVHRGCIKLTGFHMRCPSVLALRAPRAAFSANLWSNVLHVPWQPRMNLPMGCLVGVFHLSPQRQICRLWLFILYISLWSQIHANSSKITTRQPNKYQKRVLSWSKRTACICSLALSLSPPAVWHLYGRYGPQKMPWMKKQDRTK